jgi:hypothetical protein
VDVSNPVMTMGDDKPLKMKSSGAVLSTAQKYLVTAGLLPVDAVKFTTNFWKLLSTVVMTGSVVGA